MSTKAYTCVIPDHAEVQGLCRCQFVTDVWENARTANLWCLTREEAIPTPANCGGDVIIQTVWTCGRKFRLTDIKQKKTYDVIVTKLKFFFMLKVKL